MQGSETGGARRRGMKAVVVAALAIIGGTPSAAFADDVEDMLTNVALLRAAAHEAVVELLTEAPISGSEAVTVRPGVMNKSNWIVAEVLAAELTRRGVTVHVVDAPPRPARPAATTAAEPDTTDDAASVEDDAADEPDAGDILAHLQEQERERQAELEAAAAVAAGEAPPEPAARPKPLDESIVTDRVLEFRLGQFDVTYVGEGRSFVFGPKRVTRAASVDVGCRLVEHASGRVEWVGQGDAVRVDRISKSQLAAYESADYAAELPDGPGAMRYVEPVVVGGIVAGLVYLFYTNQN